MIGYLRVGHLRTRKLLPTPSTVPHLVVDCISQEFGMARHLTQLVLAVAAIAWLGVGHVAVRDALVLWAWNPGRGRTLPTLSVDEFKAALDQWAAAGAPCPN